MICTKVFNDLLKKFYRFFDETHNWETKVNKELTWSQEKENIRSRSLVYNHKITRKL